MTKCIEKEEVRVNHFATPVSYLNTAKRIGTVSAAQLTMLEGNCSGMCVCTDSRTSLRALQIRALESNLSLECRNTLNNNLKYLIYNLHLFNFCSNSSKPTLSDRSESFGRSKSNLPTLSRYHICRKFLFIYAITKCQDKIIKKHTYIYSFTKIIDNFI